MHFLAVDFMALASKQHHPALKEGTRASVTFPADLYAELERIAGEKKVSVAWVVGDAVERYIEAQYSLFRSQPEEVR
jgi:predicted DNA-binding ribbon-helix-helix protein